MGMYYIFQVCNYRAGSEKKRKQIEQTFLRSLQQERLCQGQGCFPHCPKNNLNLRIKTKPVSAEADVRFREKISGPETRHIGASAPPVTGMVFYAEIQTDCARVQHVSNKSTSYHEEGKNIVSQKNGCKGNLQLLSTLVRTGQRKRLFCTFKNIML